MEKVSIIVPIYNVEKYIEKCILSLIKQTYKNIEILAISDGSPDNSIGIVKRYAKDDERIKIIEKSNGGYGSVIEYALKIMKGKYFIICDSDDWLEENAIETLVSNIKMYDVDLVIGQKYLVYNNSEKRKIDKCYKDYYKIPINQPTDVIDNFFFVSVTPHSKLYKFEYAKNINFLHNVNYTDTTLYLLYLQRIKSVIYVDKPLSNYFIDRPGNSSTELETLSPKSFESIIKVIEDLLKQSDSSGKFYSCLNYKIYILIMFVIKRMENTNSNIKKINFLFEKLSGQKNQMKKYINDTSSLKKILKKLNFCLMINGKTRKIAIKILRGRKG